MFGLMRNPGYLGTYAEDRQSALNALFIEVARRSPRRRFVIGGSLYPETFPRTDNIHFISHVPPAEHGVFYCSSALTLNVTRGAMAAMGWCPSGRLFEAAACGAPIISHELLSYYLSGCELIMAETMEDGLRAVQDERFDLCVFDLLLPDGNALELCRRIRKFDQDTPIIILSGDVRESVEKEVEEVGAQRFIIKPVDHENLARIILTLIKG